MPNNFIKKFTKHYRQIIFNAQNKAWENKNKLVEPEHLFYALLFQEGTMGNLFLRQIKATPSQIKRSLLPAPGKNSPTQLPLLSPQTKQIIKKSALLANLYHHKFVGTEHLLYSLLENPSPRLTKFLQKYHFQPRLLKEKIKGSLKTISKFSTLSQEQKNFSSNLIKKNIPLENEMPNASLDPQEFLQELTDPLFANQCDPVIGREKEINRLIRILARRKKNNPLLLGEPGVGKTAIVEGLAKKIIQGEVPAFLLEKKIIKLDLGVAIAGTMFRGEFEARLKNIVDQIKNDPQAILFIDEIHTLVGAGISNGSLDAANILKPILTKENFSVIGATTFSDYKKHISKDKALLRRFETVKVAEPTPQETIYILKNIKKYYENFHQVKIADSALQEAVSLAERYLPQKHFPDKALDFLDEAASLAKIKKQKEDLFLLQKKLENKIQEISHQKEEYLRQENYAQALEAKKQEEMLKKDLLLFRHYRQEAEKKLLGEITDQEVQEAARAIISLPEDKIESPQKKAKSLEKKLKEKIIGQDQALNKIIPFLKKITLGLNSPERPLASFIFLGPTGVGKTETAKQISKIMFPQNDGFIKLDMSEFADKFTLSRLIGAPAGYVGYDEGGKLTEFVKHHPYSLVLFDEIEKAHPNIFNILLQILEDGYLTDSAGEKVDFKNTIIILTSNLGLKEFYFSSAIGFTDANQQKNQWENAQKEIQKKLTNFLPPELLARFDQTAIFGPLSEEALRQIIQQQIKLLNQRLKKQQLQITPDSSAIRYLAQKSWQHKAGARAARQIIQEQIENELMEIMLKEKKCDIIKLPHGKIKINFS